MCVVTELPKCKAMAYEGQWLANIINVVMVVGRVDPVELDIREDKKAQTPTVLIVHRDNYANAHP